MNESERPFRKTRDPLRLAAASCVTLQLGDDLVLSSVGAALFARYPDAVLVIDPEGVIQEANPAATRLLGYTVEELQQIRSDAIIVDDEHKAEIAVHRP